MLLYKAAFLFVICSTATSKRFPSYINKCYRNNNTTKTCFTEAVYTLRAHFKRGIPEFSLPPMNPLILPQVLLENEDNFNAEFKNVEIFHLDQLVIQDIGFNLSRNEFETKLIFPKLRIKSNYHVKGRILFFELDGNGPADGNFTDVQVETKLQGRRYQKGSREYIKFCKMEVKESVSKAHFRFDGLFKGNMELTRQMNQIVNENVDEFLTELQPAIHVAIEQTVLALVGRIFDKFSIQELFLD
ncbi:Circadian clock-controlled protein-like Protein [Tribolium castaneum]|nr:PREDICTED: uncharacterized protein LOC662151 isoform X1 [Tribolium castaneum]EFA03577.2 Circadian clock-controlled protein-like Protein [Tribolium castaneum]|eukprot:XP_973361.2 PREDICTED: uncharacterized protein LOC662151 isoform X1 [Tribolium castaneum]